MDLAKHRDALMKIGYGISADQVINSRGDVIGQCDPYGAFICDVKEIMDIVCPPTPVKPNPDLPTKPKTKTKKKYVRARNEDGHFIADDPETLDINEAWKEVK
tara:strand:+ start:443 stop:751 length:309 start_codon:yes stop_codon:yes gene_type:complete